MSTNARDKIEHFLHGQVACWNNGDREGFLDHYRTIAQKGLSIEYVGQPQGDGWAALEKMWEHQAAIKIEVILAIITGNEAACHHRNHRVNGGATETIELYKLDEGHLSARYFIKA